jgi:hypothetical protein
MSKNNSNLSLLGKPLSITEIIETRSGQLHMRFPVDVETTRRLESLTHELLPWHYRLRRWLRGRLAKM